MKKFLKLIMALSLGLAIAGCAKEYDDTALTERVKKVEDKVNTLDQKVSALTEQVTGLAAVIDQWKKGGFVESVEDVKEGGVVVGYTIKFVGGQTVTLKNGKDGKDGTNGTNGTNGKDGTNGQDGADGNDGADGKTPGIVIVDGEAVWAIDGTPIEVEGKYIPATVVPSFKINDAGHLIMTIAGKEYDLGKVVGQGGDSLFTSVDASDPDVVKFELSNGTKFEVPKAKAFKLVIETPSYEVEAGDVVKIDFTVQNGTAEMVDCFAGGNYTAVIEGNQVVVTVPDPFVEGKVLVWAQNDKGLFSMVKLNFLEGPNVIIVNPEDVKAISAEAGSVEVDVVSNVDIELDQIAETWVSAELTKAAYKLTLTIEANPTTEPREADIKILRSSNKAVLQTLHIVQVAKPEPTPFDTNVKWTASKDNKSYDDITLNVTYGDKTYEKVKNIKFGTSSAAGSAKITLPAGTTKVSFWALGWSGKAANLKFTVGEKNYDFNPAANSGVTGNGPFNVTVTDSDQYSFTLDAALAEETEITVATAASGYRAVLFGVQASDEPIVKELTVERILCKIPVGVGKAWTSEYTTTGSFIQGQDRSAATDGEYAFVVGARTDNPGILAINLTDPSDIKELDISPMTGGFLKVAALNTIYNPSTGKYILLACSLSEWSEAGDGYQFNVYAYDKGIDQAPTRILNFNDAQGRHLGEIFSVVGDWHDGEIWVRNRLSPSTLCWPLKDGVPQSPLGGNIGYDGSTGLGVIYKYGMGTNHVLLENEKLGVFYNLTVNGYFAAFEGDLWSGKDQSVMGRKYGVKPFEFDGKKFIAYTQIGKYTDPNNGARARLKIIEDQGSDATFKASIESDNILYEYPIQNSNDNATTPAEFDEVLYLDGPSFIPDNRVLGSCSVAETADAVYILSHCYNVGLSVFKMYLK